MMSTDGERCGYLDVKVPAKSRGKGIKAWKAWRRRWVVVQGMANLTTGRQLVTIDLHSQLQDHHRGAQDTHQHHHHHHHHHHRLQQRTTVCLEGAVSVRRTNSKSHPYAFAVQAAGCFRDEGREDVEDDDDDDDDDDNASIHLSGYSETDSQTWIRALRCILRNAGTSSSPLSHLRASIGQVFESSLIECLSDVYGRRQRLAGPVGYLVVLPSVLLMTSLEDGCILAELPSSTIERVSLVQNVPQPEDRDRIVVIELSQSAISNAGRLRFYSEKAKDIVTTLSNWKIKDQEHSMEAIVTSTKTAVSSDQDAVQDDPLSDGQSSEPIKETDIQVSDINVRCRRTSLYSRKSHLSGCYDTKTGLKKTTCSVKIMNRRLSKSDTDLCLANGTEYNPECGDAVARPVLTVTRPGCIVDRSMIDCEEPTTKLGETSVEQCFSLRTGTKPPPPSSSFLKLDINQRPLSQVSNDSGVMMMNTADEPTSSLLVEGKPSKVALRRYNVILPLKTAKLCIHDRPSSSSCSSSSSSSIQNHPDDGPTYRKFSDFLQCGEMTLYENLPDRMSTSSDSTIYSEIDTNYQENGDDNLYEDLDKFRKNIHKLLGIPQDVVVNVQTASKVDEHQQTQTKTLQQGPPPPLPPRGYESRNSSVHNVRRKDVMKYLGANESSNRKTIDKLMADGGDLRRHKNIYQYLGIPTMALSQPAGLNLQATEPTYDSPVQRSGTLSRKNSTSATSVVRKCSRTYVRAVPFTNASLSRRDSSCDIPFAATADTKSTKKKRMTFLRRKMSKDGSSPSERRKSSSSISSGCTYVSYDIYRSEDWKDIDTMSVVGIAPSAPSLPPPNQPPVHYDKDESAAMITQAISEEQEIQDLEEHYCVPTNYGRSLRPNTMNALDVTSQPLYVNLAALQLEASISEPISTKESNISVDVANSMQAVQEDNYLEMGASSERTSADASEYMEPLMELRRVNPSSDSVESNPFVMLESVISCIDELRAIYHKSTSASASTSASTSTAATDDSSDDIAINTASNSNDGTSKTSTNSGDKSNEPINDRTGYEDQSTTSSDGLVLRQRLSSYIDQLFSPGNMGIGEIVEADDTDEQLKAYEQCLVRETTGQHVGSCSTESELVQMMTDES